MDFNTVEVTNNIMVIQATKNQIATEAAACNEGLLLCHNMILKNLEKVKKKKQKKTEDLKKKLLYLKQSRCNQVLVLSRATESLNSA